MREVKASFLEAVRPLSEDEAEQSGIPDPSSLDNASVKLWKESADDAGHPIWLPLADTSSVEKAGLDQGHTVGVSFKTGGEERNLSSRREEGGRGVILILTPTERVPSPTPRRLRRAS